MKKYIPAIYIIYQSVVFILFIAIILLIAVYIPSPTYANDTSLGRFGETVRPIDNPNIIMQSENITVHVSYGVSNVECEFVFINDSDKEITVLMGFPSGDLEGEYKDNLERFYDYKLYDFTAWVDGEEVEVRLEKGAKAGMVDGTEEKGMNMEDLDTIMKVYNGEGIPLDSDLYNLGSDFPYWYTWEVTFKPGEKKIIKNTYETKNTTSSTGMAHTGYILTTGASWKGRIEKAEITFIMEDIKPYQVESISPTNYTYEGNMITWQFEDFEPDFNINVAFSIREEYLLKEQFKNNEKLKPIVELEDQGKYEELIEFINEIMDKEEYSDTKTALKLTKAKALLGIEDETGNEEALEEAIKLLEEATDIGGTGSTEAAYLLLECYKKTRMDKYKDLYENKIFLRTNGVFQRLATEMFHDLKSGYSPEITNLKVTPEKVCLDIEDKDDDLKKISIKVWHMEDGQKIFILDQEISDPMQFAYSHYTAKYYGFIPAAPDDVQKDKHLYYRIYAEDWAGNLVDTGEVGIHAIKKAYNVDTDTASHWAAKYADMFSYMEEVPENITDGDKYISNKELFDILIKYSNLSPREKYDQKNVFSQFLSENRYVTRAEAIDVMISLLQGVRKLKTIEQLFETNYQISETNEPILKTNEQLLKPSDEETKALGKERHEANAFLDEERHGYKFKDWDSMPPDYKNSMLIALKVGAIIGYLDGTLRPSDYITTNETLAVLARLKHGEAYRMEEEREIKRNPYLDIVLKDPEASKWFYEHTGDKYIIFEDGQWYLLEEARFHGEVDVDKVDNGVYKQECSEEFAIQVLNSLPDIYHEEKEGKIEINILQKLGNPPHRYVLIIDANTLEIVGREIRDY